MMQYELMIKERSDTALKISAMHLNDRRSHFILQCSPYEMENPRVSATLAHTAGTLPLMISP